MAYFTDPPRPVEYQKWDCITLEDFRSKSSWNWISYVWLWILAIISVAVYGSDTFTAVQLLAFNNWSSQIQPAIPFDISKWIFAGCILFSWVLLAYEWIRALRVMSRANVAESYLDPLAVVLQSMRLGGVGKGWRRFLVFSALTKSKKGADYVALFAYFQFKGAIRILLAEGPRQVINALTLYSVMRANLLPNGAKHSNTSGIEQFWQNVEILYHDKKEQAIILSTMLFTLVIWVFSALCLLASCLLYIGFLWHYIPREDGTLSKYCRRKVNTRLERIVTAKANAIAALEEAKRRQAEKANPESDAFVPKPVRQPTLPTVAGQDNSSMDALISRPPSDTSVPPPYSLPGTEQSDGRVPSLPQLPDDIKPPPRLFRTGSESTVASNVSYGAQPTIPQLQDGQPDDGPWQEEPSQYASRPPRPLRSDTQSTVASNVSYGPRPPLPPMPNGRRPPPGPTRMGSQSTVASNVTYGPPVHSPEEFTSSAAPPYGRPNGPIRSQTQSSGFSAFSDVSDRPLLDRGNTDTPSRNFSRGPQRQMSGPAYEMSTPRSTSVPPQQPPQPVPQNQPTGGYRPYSPASAQQSQPAPRSQTPGTYRPYSPASGPQQQSQSPPQSQTSQDYRPFSPANAQQSTQAQPPRTQTPGSYGPFSPANAQQSAQPPPQNQSSGGYRPYSPASSQQRPPRSESRAGPPPGQGRSTPRPA